MKHSAKASLIGLIGLAVVSANALADNDRHRGARVYEVTITNLTRGQVFSPPIAVTHPSDIALFTAGEAASDGIAAIAQNGDASVLEGALSGVPGVHTVVAGGPVLPGTSAVIEVSAGSRHSVLSVVGMAVSSNDAFVAVDGVPLPRSRLRSVEVEAVAYDAGAEDNDESCAYIPGPPCGAGPGQSDVPGEGYVFVHAGIQGVGDLDPSLRDWRNPVAKISVRRLSR